MGRRVSKQIKGDTRAMKLVKKSGKQVVKMSKREWETIGKKAGWVTAGKNNQEEYKFYVVDGKQILSAWEYREDAKDSLSDFGRGKIVSKSTLVKNGMDPDNDSNWLSPN